MKNKSAKTVKLLSKALEIKNKAMKMPYSKDYEKKLKASEKLSRKALELSRADIAAGVNSGSGDLISAIYNLGSLLFVEGRFNEAEQLFAEARACRGFDEHTYALAIDAYYGCILCHRRDYERSSEVFDKLMDSAEQNEQAAFIDTYALANAYGDAACAFTYAEEGSYPGKRFTEPLERLIDMQKKGVPINDNVIKKAAYFSASQQLYYMCCDCVSLCNSDGTILTADICLHFCKSSGMRDFYTFAAMRILAFAAARDLRYKDCAAICERILELCGENINAVPESPYGSIHDIIADIHLLLGILHYRVEHDEIAMTHFRSAIDALNADAKGRPLDKVGYADVEAIVMPITSAEKMAFAYEYIGAAMHNQPEKFTLKECMSMFEESIRHIKSVSDEPYFCLSAASKYSTMSDWCREAGALQEAADYEQMSRKHWYFAIANLKKTVDDRELYETYCERLTTRKRLALRRGLLEEYSDCLRCELLMHDEPYTQPDPRILGMLHYHMGDYCRVTGRYKQALEHLDKVRECIYDADGNLLKELRNNIYPESAMLARAEVLNKLDEPEKALESFEEFISLDTITSGGELDVNERVRIARIAHKSGFNASTCAKYMHIAAVMSAESGENHMRTADLFNQEGISWYNASPENDDPDAKCNCDECKEHCEKFEPMNERYARLTEMFAANELKAFENSYDEIVKCDQNLPEVISMMPMLLSNMAECYMRAEKDDKSLEHYSRSVAAFERLFALPLFGEKEQESKDSDIFQYAECHKSMGDIYEKNGDNVHAMEAYSKAIEIFMRIDADAARYNASYCLNVRGSLSYRKEDYQKAVDDLTLAIKLRSDIPNSEISIAIMLKNRADAYHAMGDYKSMQSDLSKSIDVLDRSQVPKELLNSVYGEHLFVLGICQEEMDNAGNAADSYRRASQHLSAAATESDSENLNMQMVCHFRRAKCLCKRDEHEFYGALTEYNSTLELLEKLPPSGEKNEQISAVLYSRGELYEAFKELELARDDYKRAESLRPKLLDTAFIQFSDKNSHDKKRSS